MKYLGKLFISSFLIFSFFVISMDSITINHQNNDPSLIVSSQNSKVIYLSFDDGPSMNTQKILDILDKYEINATFFVVGPSYQKKNDLLNQIIKSGHTIAIHSFNHIYSQIYNSKDDYLNDFNLSVNWIKNITGISPNLYRFPGGSSNTIANKDLIKEIIIHLDNLGYKHVDWNVDSLDSKYNNDSTSIINKTINDIKTNESNGVYTQTILMHDNTKKVATVDSLATIIEYCLSKGYVFDTLTIDSPLSQHVKKP